MIKDAWKVNIPYKVLYQNNWGIVYSNIIFFV
jgi:hypothetical protein